MGDLKSIYDWYNENNLNEKGMRTMLGPYPDSYGVANYPDSYLTPISATAGLSLQNWHGRGKPAKKKAAKKKTTKKKPGKKK